MFTFVLWIGKICFSSVGMDGGLSVEPTTNQLVRAGFLPFTVGMVLGWLTGLFKGNP